MGSERLIRATLDLNLPNYTFTFSPLDTLTFNATLSRHLGFRLCLCDF
jgi:hypothetical protein